MKKTQKCLQELVKIWNCCRIKYKGTRWERQKYITSKRLLYYAKEPRFLFCGLGNLEVV